MKLLPRLGLALTLGMSLLGLAGFALAGSVLAQAGTVLAVEPAQANVEVNGKREIQLYVTAADNLNAFDVQVEYDGSLLSLAKWEFGDLLSNLAVVKRDDLSGSFRLVATQLATPGVSGDGVLLKLTFSGKQTGTSSIMITKAEFAASLGGLSLPERQNGSLTVVPATPTRTPTFTATFLPTSTATNLPSATAVPTNTATLVPTAMTGTATSLSPTPSPTTQGEQSGLATGTAVPQKPGEATSQAEQTKESETQPTEQTPQALAAIEEGEPGAPAEQSSANGAGSGLVKGEGYFLERSNRGNLRSVVMVLSIIGSLACIAAIVLYLRKRRAPRRRKNEVGMEN